MVKSLADSYDLLFRSKPISVLDKGVVSDMRQYLLGLKAQDKKIIIASHSAEDIDVLCDTVYEMDKGKLQKVR